MGGEAASYSAGRQDVFTNGLNVYATRLREFKQCTPHGNLRVGVGSETAVRHGIASDALVADGGEEGGNAELGGDVANDGKEISVPELEQEFV